MNKDNDEQLSAARWKQQLEVRRDGLCNSLTTASKDNMVLEIIDGKDIEHCDRWTSEAPSY